MSKKLSVVFFFVLSFLCEGYIIAQNFQWAKGVGGDFPEYGSNITVDPFGNSYLTGRFRSSSIAFGNYTLINADDSGNTADIFVAKYDSWGNVKWAKSWGIDFIEEPTGIYSGKNGSVYITGTFFGPSVNFDAYTLINADSSGNTSNIFIIKCDSSGNVQWAKGAGQIRTDMSLDIAVDNDENSYITGVFFSDFIVFGSDTLLLSDNANGDVFIAKYDSSGNMLWAKSAKGNDTDGASSITTDANGNSYITGNFSSDSILFGDIAVYGIYNVIRNFVVKYDSSGNTVWAKVAAEGNGYGYCKDIAVDKSGNTYITGSFYGQNVVFGNTTLINTEDSAGVSDIFIVKYDTSGNVLWAKSEGGFLGDESVSIAANANGDIYITGRFQSPAMNFGGYVLTNAGNTNNTLPFPSDIFIAKYDSSGNISWAKSIGEIDDNDDGEDVALDNEGNCYITGTFNSPVISFGNITLTNSGFEDIFIVKLDTAKTSGTTIIGELMSSEVNVFPVPATNTIFINGRFSLPATIELCDLIGRRIFSKTIISHQFSVDISSFPQGIYIYQLHDQETIQWGKLVKE